MGGEQAFTERQFQTRRVRAVAVAQLQKHLRLIDRHPVGDAITDLSNNSRGVLREPRRAVAIQPSTAMIQSERIVPMEQRDPRFDVVRKKAVDQTIIKVESCFVNFSDAAGNHPRPCDGQPIGV